MSRGLRRCLASGRAAGVGLVVGSMLATALTGCGSADRPTARLRIMIRPSTILIDAAPSVAVGGLRAGQVIRVIATTRRLENVWSASATYRAGRGGTVDLAHDPPLDHAYDGTAALGLLGVQTPGTAVRGQSGPLVTTFTVHAGRRSAGARLRQLTRAAAVRVRVETVGHEGFDGRLYLPPPGRARAPGVVVWGGSEGGLSTGSAWAQVLASHGIPALGIAYFDAPGLPCALSRIPLEYFARAVRWMRRRPGVDPHRVWLLSGSRGSEAEALLAAHFPRLIHGFVAEAPSSTAYGSFPGTCRPRSRTAWTLRGTPVLSARVDIAVGESGLPDSSRRAFMATLHTRRTRRARIPIAGFRGPVLLLAGGDDGLWPSPIYSTQMMHELAGDPAPHERRVYREAGHLVLDPPSIPEPTETRRGTSLGGTEAADDAAHRADWPLMLGFITRN